MNRSLLLVVSLAMAIMVPACVGTIYHQDVDLGGGDKADVVGRTGVFGTDLAAIRFKSKAPADLDILRLQSYESEQETRQTYDQKCPDPKQLKNIKTVTVNRQKTSFRDVPNPNKRQDQINVIGGTNPSTGNVLLPAAAKAAGMATMGFGFPGTEINTSATGGRGGGGTAAGGTGLGGAGGTNTNTNTNTNTATGTGTASSSSTSGATATSN